MLNEKKSVQQNLNNNFNDWHLLSKCDPAVNSIPWSLINITGVVVRSSNLKDLQHYIDMIVM